jgi:hypothetical protein
MLQHSALKNKTECVSAASGVATSSKSLTDNRPASVVQKKQVEALTNKNGEAPIQRKASKTVVLNEPLLVYMDTPIQGKFTFKDISAGAKKGAMSLGSALSFPGRALMSASNVRGDEPLITQGAKYAGKATGALLAGAGGLLGGLVGAFGGAIAGSITNYGSPARYELDGHANGEHEMMGLLDSSTDRIARRHIPVVPRSLTESEARNRMQKAENRQVKRMNKGNSGLKRGQNIVDVDYDDRMKKNGNRLPIQTPFGTAHLGRGPYNNQPLLGLEPNEWENPIIKTNYDELISKVKTGGNPMLDEMLEHLETKGHVQPSQLHLDDLTSQAGTALTGLLTSAEPHKTRNPVGGKPERASVRYARVHGLALTYNRKNGAYVPAWAEDAGADKGGTGAFREMRKGKRPIPKNTLDMLGYMSDSSDDEE